MITFYTDGDKYFTKNVNGVVIADRHGSAWRSLAGDGYVLSLVQTIEQLADSLQSMVDMHEAMMKKVNHAASFYDADCIQRMNEAPVAAREVLNGLRMTNDDRNG